MPYHLKAADLALLSDLRLEVMEAIRSRNLPEAIQNELQLSFNVWLDSQSLSLYKTGTALICEAPHVTNDNIFTA
jgi:hypothetical protein